MGNFKNKTIKKTNILTADSQIKIKDKVMEDFLYKEETYKIIGILFEVHKNLGKGFSEIVYKDAIEYEFQQEKISYQREKEFSVNYKTTTIKT